MKKAYFVTYLGALFTCLGTLLLINKTAQKYGQAIYPKKGINFASLASGAEKLIDTVMSFKK